MTKEEKLIAEFLKKKQPKKIPDSLVETTPYDRQYIKMSYGKYCSYCNTQLDAFNVFIKTAPNRTKMISTEIILCKDCNGLSDADKKILNKVDYDTYLKIKSIKAKLLEYKNTRKEELKTLKDNLDAIKYETRYAHFSKDKLAKRNSLISEAEFKIEQHNVTTEVNIDILNNEITNLMFQPNYELKKYKMDYRNINFIKKIEEEDY